jgi:anti-sigma regulatory factor (Ser/Thr protein kinase)
MNTAENQMVHLTLASRLDFLPGATSLVREIAGKLGLDDKDARRLELGVEEACVNVIRYAFEDDPSGALDIVVSRRPGQIVIAVEDRGLPLDYKKMEEAQESGLGLVLMRAFADEVHFLNLGRNGKRVELVKNLPERTTNSLLREMASQKEAKEPVALQEKDVTVRLMRPEESLNLARCAYRCYGYTYSTDNFYFPERVSELVRSGLMVSVVAVNPENEIIGHLSVSKETADSPVGESGQAVVDPRSRGGGLFKKMKAFMTLHNQKAGMLGAYGEAVTVHVYTQKVAIAGDAFETGVLLGFTPATMYFKNIQGEERAKRRPVILLYEPLNPAPLRDIYLPPHHSGILRRIYDRSKMARRFITAAETPDLPERSRVNVKVQTEASRAFLQVLEYGRDLEELIKFRLKELCARRVDCIYLDLPLGHPAVQRCCVAMEMLGFFFGGIMPELHRGDVLRLQYINNADLELEKVEIEFDLSKEIFRYVLKAGKL